MSKTKTFRVAVEGATVDGRVIERNWLTEAAASYDPATYGARVNLEHIRGVTADKPFKAYGDVLSLSTQEIDLNLGGKTQKKLALFAEIEASDDLVAMNADRQKIYTSIEIAPSFADTGKAYMVGLAVTDSPASLGTEALSFAVKHPGTFRNAPAPQHKDNVFSVGMETSFELAAGEVVTPTADSAAGMFAAATAFFKNLTSGKATETPPPPPPPPAETPDAANDNDQRFTAMINGIEKLTGAMQQMGLEIRSDMTKLRGEHDTLKASVERTEAPGQAPRKLASGGGAGEYSRAVC